MRIAIGLLSLLLTATLLHADQPDPRKAAREVLAKHPDAVVTVKLLVKTGRMEQQLEVAGTVLSPEGLTVISDFTSSPSLFGDPGRSETSDVKIVQKDGTEVAARFVLRDPDLDLAFLMPKEKVEKAAHVKLDKRTPPEPLDDVIFLRRLGRNLNREASITLGRVEAVVKRPRTFIVPDLVTGLQNLGCPVFDAEGKPIGIVVVRRSSAAGRMSGLMDLLEAMRPVILTAEDLQEAFDQISKPAEEKP